VLFFFFFAFWHVVLGTFDNALLSFFFATSFDSCLSLSSKGA
jgi:hypothetical protein